MYQDVIRVLIQKEKKKCDPCFLIRKEKENAIKIELH